MIKNDKYVLKKLISQKIYQPKKQQHTNVINKVKQLPIG